MYLYILYFKQRLSHSKIGLLKEHTRVKQAAPSPEGGRGGGLFVLVVTPLLFKKALDFSHLYAKRLGT